MGHQKEAIMDMTDQRVLVVGGSSGMGLATAKAAAREGARVTIASSNPRRVEAALRELPDGCAGEVLDVRDEAQVAAVLESVGRLDHLVFTAGDDFTRRPLRELPLADARASLDVRFWGSVTVIKHALDRLSSAGSISLTTGTVGQRPMPGTVLAAAGAGALEGLVRGLAVELAPVRVNAVRAGAFRTPLWDGVPEPQRHALFDRLARGTLVGAVGEPEQIALGHLCLMQNGYVTGTILGIDGGSLLAAG
jgi:NAD(P)-dependent dehydrogenase (short-subunit alcohol dehydrogenase family)